MTPDPLEPPDPDAMSHLRAALAALLPVEAGIDANAPVPVLVEHLRANERTQELHQVRARALGIVGALIEFERATDRLVMQSRIDRSDAMRRRVLALIRENSDLFSAAASRRGTFTKIQEMYGNRANARAAYAFAFGPLEAQEALERALGVLERVVDDACAVTGQSPTRGRRDQDELVAATQQLAHAGYSPEEIVDLLPDGIVSARKYALKRVRNRLAAPDCRTRF